MSNFGVNDDYEMGRGMEKHLDYQLFALLIDGRIQIRVCTYNYGSGS
jgi:hypothetical protein